MDFYKKYDWASSNIDFMSKLWLSISKWWLKISKIWLCASQTLVFVSKLRFFIGESVPVQIYRERAIFHTRSRCPRPREVVEHVTSFVQSHFKFKCAHSLGVACYERAGGADNSPSHRRQLRLHVREKPAESSRMSEEKPKVGTEAWLKAPSGQLGSRAGDVRHITISTLR